LGKSKIRLVIFGGLQHGKKDMSTEEKVR
jgi:hypothetical protein